MERRRAAHLERLQVAEDRWRRFQAASRRLQARRGGFRVRGRLATLLARGKAPGRMLLLQLSGLWDEAITESLGSTPGPTLGLADYVRAGPDPTAQPRALFDQSWYLAKAPNLVGGRWALIAHYLVVGDSHGLSPHPLLDAPAYRARHGAAARARGLTALEHFLFEGAAAGADPHPLFDLRHYVGQCEELAVSGENPLIHYLRRGWREGLSPHPLFAGDWYLARYPHAAHAGVAPLLHYLTHGADEGLDPHPLFDHAHYRRQRGALLHGDPLVDYLAGGARARRSPSPHFQPAYYLEHAGETPAAQADPLTHYLTHGAFEGLWPAADFNEAGYVSANRDLATAPLSGLEHWLRHKTARPDFGAPAGRAISAEALFADLRRATDPDPGAYDNAAYQALRRRRRHKGRADDVSVIVLRRTTAPDWTRVAHALPNFRGHLQPRLPADGFADPKDPGQLRRDVRLAQRYGIAAFCHEVGGAAAVRAVTGPKAPAFPYCLAWTGPKAAEPALKTLAPALPGALRLDGRPVVLASPEIDPAAWRKAAGAGGLFLVQRGGKPRAGFDARLPDAETPRAAEGPPGPVVNPDFRGAVHDARAVIAERMAAEDDALPLVLAGHDTTPLSQDAPQVWHGASPGALQAWLEAAADRARGRPKGQRLVFVQAWNDWETGAAIGPDLRFGHGWLEAVANAADADLLSAPAAARSGLQSTPKSAS
jgi:hypothetical protein